MSSKKNLVTIILITWNALAYTKLCLESIFKYTNYPFKLVIVDNGSHDGTQRYLRSLRAKLILNQKNKGFPHALNQGYDAAKSNYLCILNNDIIVSRDWLKILVKVYGEHPRVKAIGPIRPARFTRYPFSQEDSKSVLERIKQLARKNSLTPREQLNLFCNRYPYDQFVEEFKKCNPYGDTMISCPPGILSTCCVLVEKKFLKSIGGIVDTRYKIYGADDADLCWRIAKAGYQIMITSQVYVHHFEHVSADLNKLNRGKLIRENSRRFFLKWRKFFWKYINERLDEGLTLEDISQEHWLIQRILQVVKAKEVPQDIKILSTKNAQLKTSAKELP